MTTEGIIKRSKNLKHVKPGQILNPKGRVPINKNIWKWVSRLCAPEKYIEPMRKLYNYKKGRLTIEEAIILRLATEACRGDVRAIELWIERKYGKITTPVELNSRTGPLVCIINAQEKQKEKIIPQNDLIEPPKTQEESPSDQTTQEGSPEDQTTQERPQE